MWTCSFNGANLKFWSWNSNKYESVSRDFLLRFQKTILITLNQTVSIIIYLYGVFEIRILKIRFQPIHLLNWALNWIAIFPLLIVHVWGQFEKIKWKTHWKCSRNKCPKHSTSIWCHRKEEKSFHGFFFSFYLRKHIESELKPNKIYRFALERVYSLGWCFFHIMLFFAPLFCRANIWPLCRSGLAEFLRSGFSKEILSPLK